MSGSAKFVIPLLCLHHLPVLGCQAQPMTAMVPPTTGAADDTGHVRHCRWPPPVTGRVLQHLSHQTAALVQARLSLFFTGVQPPRCSRWRLHYSSRVRICRLPMLPVVVTPVEFLALSPPLLSPARSSSGPSLYNSGAKFSSQDNAHQSRMIVPRLIGV